MVYNPRFWSEEHAKYLSSINPALLRMLLAGGESGARMLGAGIERLMDWDYFNDAAIAFMEDYGLSYAQGITDTTQRQTIKLIDRWIRSGEKLPNLIKSLEPIFGRKRAEMIGVTEVTRVFAEGNIIAWKSTGLVSGKKWMTARDELVCPYCAPLSEMIVEIDSNGFTTDISPNALGVYAPPIHPRCRCWLQPVVTEAHLEEIIANMKVEYAKYSS